MLAVERLDTSKDPFELGVELPDGELTVEDEQILKKYAEGKDLAVDLGTYRGRSAVILSLFAKRVVTVDVYGDWRLKEHPDLTFENVQNSLRQYQNIEVIKSGSWQAADRFEDNSIDLLFVDAGHSKKEVTDDFGAFLPKMKSGGIAVFHDYKYMVGQVPHLAVKPAVDEIVQSGRVVPIEVRGWCMVVRIRNGAGEK